MRKVGGYDFISSLSMNHDEDRGPVGLCGIQEERYIPTYPGTTSLHTRVSGWGAQVPGLHILFGLVSRASGGVVTRQVGGHDFISSLSMNHAKDRGPVGLCGSQEERCILTQ